MRSNIVLFVIIQCFAWSYFFQDLSKEFIKKGMNVVRMIKWNSATEENQIIFEKTPEIEVVILREDGTFTWFFVNGQTTEGLWNYAGSSSIVHLNHPDFQQSYSIESTIDNNLLLLGESNSHAYYELAENKQHCAYLNH
ncbi:MAG: hypothetical protein JJU28_14050 [Cyclobacteriaceae bacterium]|nr:hypothetical protein [Cyclobacteriaceae bacterium]